MPKTLTISLIIASVLVLLGGAAIYITKQITTQEETRQTDEGIKMEQGGAITKEAAVRPKEPVIQPEQPTPAEPIDTSSWRTYRNEELGFEMRYPSRLSVGKRLSSQPFNPGLEGTIIITLSDQLIDELVIAVAQGSLDGFVVRDNPGGVLYTFNQRENRWISSARGEVTGQEPKLLNIPVLAYGYRNGDGICRWHGAVVPHPSKNYVLEFVYARCIDEGQQTNFPDRIPSLIPILSTLKMYP